MPSERRPPVVLVAGALLGGWAWRDTARELRAHGHDVFPATLTGLGDRSHLARPDVDLAVHIEDVVRLLDAEDLRDVVLVGHSYAGIVITGVADRRPERLGSVIWLDSSPALDGMAIVDLAPPENRARQERDVQERGDGWLWPVVDADALKTGMYGSVAGLDDAQIAALLARATPQPWATFTSPLRLTRRQPAPLRRVMLICTAGGLTAAAVQAMVEQGDPRAAAVAGPGWEFHELATGHWAMFSAPVDLAEALHRIAVAPGERPRSTT